MKAKKIIYIFGLLIYLVIAFVTEYFYRDKLYEKSLDYEEDIKQHGFFHDFYFFWAIIFLIAMLSLGLLITLLCYPINTFFSYFSIPMVLVLIMSILKSIYSNPRPFWDIYLEMMDEKENINSTEKYRDPTECDGGFGNPSGHALLSTYLLCLRNLFINSKYFEKLEGAKKIIIRYFSLILSISFMIFIIYSRINRQIHSINQVLFGGILGLAVFFTFCHILEVNKIPSNVFMDSLHKAKYIIIPISLIFFALSVFIGLKRHNGKEDEYFTILEEYCGYERNELFGKNTAFASTIIFILIGGYLGLLFLRYKIIKYHPNNEDHFYNWNAGKKRNTCKIILFSFVLPLILSPSFILISLDHYTLKLIVSAIFYFVYGLLSMGILFYYGCVIFKKDEYVDTSLLTSQNEEEMQI